MKNIQKLSLISFLFLGFLIFSGCSKDDEPTRNNTNNVDNNNNPVGQDGEITLYKVNGEKIEKVTDYKVSGTDLTYQKDTQKHQEIWSLIKKVVPPNYRTKMSEFLIYNGESSGSAGFVVQKKQDLSKWQMGIAINYSSNKQELIYTIIHEFGHILTLNNNQINASISESACQNYFVGEGCAKANAYINKLQTQYWADIWSEYKSAQDSESAMQQFYNNYKSRFVTQYAATNPGEDIAEVFAVFVTRNGGVNGSTIAEKKIQLMYDHNELVELRNYIRGNLTSNSQTGRAISLLPAPGTWKQANTFGNTKKSHCSH